jgi:hypothetical protein
VVPLVVGSSGRLEGDAEVFEIREERPEDNREISSRMVRRIKNNSCKSRFVLRDFANAKAMGGELYAATPSLQAVRAATWVASRRQHEQ